MTDLREAWEHFTALRARESVGAIDQGDLAAAEQEAFVAALGGVLRERDEAVETLRETFGHMESGDLNSNEMDPVAMRAVAALERRILSILQGAERTHALVPVGVCRVTAEGLRTLADAGERFGVSAPDVRELAEQFEAAARGERVYWPGDSA